MNKLAFGIPGPTETIIIIFAILLLFGSKKLPELARALGKSLNEFKRGQNENAPEAIVESDEKKTDKVQTEEKND